MLRWALFLLRERNGGKNAYKGLAAPYISSLGQILWPELLLAGAQDLT